MKIIGIDMGKANLKAFDGVREFACASTFAEGVDKLESGYQVLHNGKKYLIGDTTLNYDLEITKEKTQHRMMMYLAIFNLVSNGEHVGVVTSCPVDIFLNKQSKNSYRRFLQEDDKVTLTVGNKTKTFYIDALTVVAEGSGYLFQNPEQCADEMIGLIDIGGSTTNYILANDLNVVRGQSFCEADGMHYLRVKIRDVLKKNGVVVGENEVKYLLKDMGAHKYIINGVINTYLDGIKKHLIARNWSENTKLGFVGGGSLELKRQIEEKFPHSTISSDALFDNCYGNHRIGVLIWEKSRE